MRSRTRRLKPGLPILGVGIGKPARPRDCEEKVESSRRRSSMGAAESGQAELRAEVDGSSTAESSTKRAEPDRDSFEAGKANPS